jgi:hypothetical protein
MAYILKVTKLWTLATLEIRRETLLKQAWSRIQAEMRILRMTSSERYERHSFGLPTFPSLQAGDFSDLQLGQKLVPSLNFYAKGFWAAVSCSPNFLLPDFPRTWKEKAKLVT